VPPTPPAPAPDPSGSFLVVITDNDNRTPEQAAQLQDEEMAKWLAEKKVQWIIVDKAGAAFTVNGYDKVLAAANVQPPALILFGPDRAANKTTPWINTNDGVKTWIAGTPHKECPFIVVDGVKRYLTCLPPAQAKFMAPRGGEFKDSHTVIPRNQWREVNNRSKFPVDKFIFDQDGIGSCVGNGSTDSLMKVRALMGMSYQRLAPGCTYSQINGGRDQGAVISDSLTALQQTGTITSQTLGSDEKPFYSRQMPSGWKTEAARFRIEEAYHCATFDEIGSAIELGYIVVYGIQVGQNFNTFTAEGVAGQTPGPGNHCMHADGIHKLADGTWALDNCNSWGDTWGPWKNGRCYLAEKHFLYGDQPDAYAVKTAVQDPLDPIKPPNKNVANADGTCGCTTRSECTCEPGTCRCPKCMIEPAKNPPDGIKKPHPTTLKADDGRGDWTWDEVKEVWWRYPKPLPPPISPLLIAPTSPYCPSGNCPSGG
jgi:hypothetical protein